jgi:(E)-4-hydroxy-3-methylbut-2-enyl-diphosphate synthase
VKSTLGIGVLLLEGIGNTIRVSLTADPVQEVRLAKEILAVVGLRKKEIELISCPTCSRTSVDLLQVVGDLEERLKRVRSRRNIKVAVMGCEVNGPGEAMDATIGLAFSKQQGYIFKEGQLIEKVNLDEALDRLIQRIEELQSKG